MRIAPASIHGQCSSLSPYVPVVVGPRVGWAAVANQVANVGDVKLSRGPVIEGLEPRGDHAVVEHPRQPVLDLEGRLQVEPRRVVGGKHVAEREERAGHSHPWITEDSAERREPTESQARRRVQRVRVQDAEQGDVKEEALRQRLLLGEIAVLQVRANNAGVVPAIPVPTRRLRDERHPRRDR